MSKAPAQGEAGFTLVEVLVALAILAVALPILLGIFGDTLRRSRDSEARMVAAQLAQSLLAGAGTESPLALGETQGDFGNGYRWQLVVTPYQEPGSDAAWSLKAYLVKALVTWSGRHEQSVALTTLRLAPKERSQ